MESKIHHSHFSGFIVINDFDSSFSQMKFFKITKKVSLKLVTIQQLNCLDVG